MILSLCRKLEEAKTAALLAEQERMLVEEQLEKTREEEEKEERLANVTFLDQDREVKSIDHCRDDEITCDITDQDREEKPYDPITDDETQVNIRRMSFVTSKEKIFSRSVMDVSCMI